MAKRESGTTPDEHYDLISVLYHALQGDETLGQYIEDAENAEDQDLAEHFRDIQEKYREIAQQTKELLKEKLLSEESEEDEEEE
jgi:arginine utilization protein RocB